MVNQHPQGSRVTLGAIGSFQRSSKPFFVSCVGLENYGTGKARECCPQASQKDS